MVVGAGLAGLRAVGALRESGFSGEISVLGSEGLAPYDRPPLTTELFTRPEPAWLADELGSDLFDLADHVELATPARALAAVTTRKGLVRVDAADGSELFADVVVIATGSHPRRPADWDAVMGLDAGPDAYINPIDDIRLEADENRRGMPHPWAIHDAASASSPGPPPSWSCLTSLITASLLFTIQYHSFIRTVISKNISTSSP